MLSACRTALAALACRRYVECVASFEGLEGMPRHSVKGSVPGKAAKTRASGNLRIGDHWNAITIIALSQSNPLKAVAELVENSIDARAKSIVITRGKERGQHYLRVKDDGEGVRRNADGEPDFQYVATHVCDSIKRQLKTQGTRGL